MTHKDFSIFIQLGDILSRPTSGYSSLLGISRRLRLSDDALRRAIARLEADLAVQLVSTAGRLTLTGAGLRVYRLARQLLQVGSADDAEPVDSVTVEIDGLVADRILPLLLPAFFKVWQGNVSLKFCPMNGQIRTNIASGITSFGVSIEQDGDEVIKPGFPWYLIGPEGTRFSTDANISDLLEGQIVFLPPVQVQPEGIETILGKKSPAHRVECATCRGVESLVGEGLGFGFIPSLLLVEDASSYRLPSRLVPERAPLQVSLHLPRNPETLSDPSRFLVSEIREAITCLAGRRAATKPEQEFEVDPEVQDENIAAEYSTAIDEMAETETT